MTTGHNGLALSLAALALLTLPCAQAQAASAPSAESRLKQLEDYQAIQQLLATYITALGASDWPAYANVFADDGELNFLTFHLKGHDAILAVMDPARRQATAPPVGTGAAAAPATAAPTATQESKK
jgi:SnoaL-like domain